MTDYNKLTIAIRHWLIGRKYFDAIAAMDLASSHHIGHRKGGQPEFSHQIEQAAYARTIEPMFENPEQLFCVIFMHDMVEDPGGLDNQKYPLDKINDRFGNIVGDAVWRMTNQYIDGTKKNVETYYGEIGDCPIASICKGLDRIHNQGSMHGVFTMEKQHSYILETDTHIIPMLKKARKLFPKQEMVYHNIKFILHEQMKLVKSLQNTNN